MKRTCLVLIVALIALVNPAFANESAAPTINAGGTTYTLNEYMREGAQVKNFSGVHTAKSDMKCTSGSFTADWTEINISGNCRAAGSHTACKASCSIPTCNTVTWDAIPAYVTTTDKSISCDEGNSTSGNFCIDEANGKVTSNTGDDMFKIFRNGSAFINMHNDFKGSPCNYSIWLNRGNTGENKSIMIPTKCSDFERFMSQVNTAGTELNSLMSLETACAPTSFELCANMPPTPTATEPTECLHTYSWITGGWGSCTGSNSTWSSWSSWSSCSKSCGGGTQSASRSCNNNSTGSKSRSVQCKRDDGVIVADSFCTTAKPSTTKSCTMPCSGSATTSQSCNTDPCCTSGPEIVLTGHAQYSYTDDCGHAYTYVPGCWIGDGSKTVDSSCMISSDRLRLGNVPYDGVSYPCPASGITVCKANGYAVNTCGQPGEAYTFYGLYYCWRKHVR